MKHADSKRFVQFSSKICTHYVVPIFPIQAIVFVQLHFHAYNSKMTRRDSNELHYSECINANEAVMRPVGAQFLVSSSAANCLQQRLQMVVFAFFYAAFNQEVITPELTPVNGAA